VHLNSAIWRFNLPVGKAEKDSCDLNLGREGTNNSAGSPNSIINDLIFITPDGSTSLNGFQGVVCVCVLVRESRERFENASESTGI
jgi:hypothetical protein